MKSNRTLVLAAIILTIALGSGVVAYAITNGQPDGNGHPFVAMTYNGSFTCSGVAISQNVVVTAAHCALSSGQHVSVTFDSQATFQGGNWHGGTIYPHPDWAFRSKPGLGLPGFDTHDVAVIVLDEPVSLPTYAVLPTAGLVDTLPMKAALTVVGYGIHGYLRGGGNPFNNPDVDFTRYHALTELVASENRQSNEYIKLTANPAQDKGGICFGDSGGPALLGNIVLGITSYVPSLNCTGVTYSNRIDLDYALAFINSFTP